MPLAIQESAVPQGLPGPAEVRPGAGAAALRRPLAVLLGVMLYLAVTFSLYVDRMTLLHEEPRRTIVAQEMILRGDYVVPSVFQRPYFKKPPFHNWLIALTALPGGHVSARGARSLSLAAFLGLGGLVYVLLRRTHPAGAAVAALMTLTSYLAACEYANRAEPDMLLALLGFLTYFFYMKRPWRWPYLLLSALCMGLGILTKGVLPLFFYPGMLIWILTGGRPRARGLALLGLHLLLSLVAPALWAAALWQRGDLGALLHTGMLEIASKTSGGAAAFIRHLYTYPLRLVLVLLPWSVAVAVAFRRAPHRGALYRSSFWIALCAVAAFTLASGSRDRYILPAIPFLALVAAHHFDGDRHVPRLPGQLLLGFLGLACLAGAVAGIALGYFPQAAVFLAATGIAAVLLRRHWRAVDYALVVALFVITAYEHGVYYHRAVRKGSYDTAVSQIGERADPAWPLVVDEHVPLIHLAFYLQAGLGRPVYGSGVAPGGHYYLITTPSRADSAGRELLRLPYPRGDVGEVVLQEIDPQATPEESVARGAPVGSAGPAGAGGGASPPSGSVSGMSRLR